MKKSRALPEPLSSLLKFFASVQLTVFVLLILALTSIIGTLIPQNQTPHDYLHAFGEFRYRLFAVLDFFDMYHSWWFQLLLLILTLNILVCSLERLPALWRMVFAKNKQPRRNRFRRSAARAEFSSSGPRETLVAGVHQVVGRGFARLRQAEGDAGLDLYAEKWRWNRLGVYVVHLSIILLLLGGLLGSLTGFDGFVNIAEGEAVDTIRLRGGGDQTLKLPFKVRCDDFDVSFYDDGAPKEFRSKLTLLTLADEPILTRDIIVNDPLRYKGISFYQSSYGKLDAPGVDAARLASVEFVLNFQSTGSGMGYMRKLKVNDSLELPEKLGTFTLQHYLPRAEFGGQAIGEALVGVMKTESEAAQQILLPLQFPNFDKMRKGAVVISVVEPAPGKITGEAGGAERFYTGLQVAKDPGVWVVYTGFILMIAGCFITFFLPHQQLLVEIEPRGRAFTVRLMGVAPRNKFGIRRKVALLSEKLQEKLEG